MKIFFWPQKLRKHVCEKKFSNPLFPLTLPNFRLNINRFDQNISSFCTIRVFLFQISTTYIPAAQPDKLT